MLNIHALSYEHIGPFRGKVNLLLKPGNVLIKAPIGTGKSFLFFDGPIYSLYKYASRNLINAHASTGSIWCLFEIADQLYLVQRNLKRTSVKEGCQSLLFLIKGNTEDILERLFQQSSTIVSRQGDLREWIQDSGGILENINFKNEIDLQQQLDQILPPQEVVTSTLILFQDSENIFQMQPAERIEVFKHIFGMSGIEEAKEKLSDLRKTTTGMIKAKQDISTFQNQFQRQLRDLILALDALPTQIRALLPSFFDFIEPVRDQIDKLSIEGTDLSNLKSDQLESALRYVQDQFQSSQLLQHQYTLLQEQIAISRKQFDDAQNQLTQDQQSMSQLESALKDFDPQSIDLLHTEKTSLNEQIEKNESRLPREQSQKFAHQYQKLLGDIVFPSRKTELGGWLNLLVQHGQHTAQSIRSLEEQHKALLQQTDVLHQRLRDLDYQQTDSKAARELHKAIEQRTHDLQMKHDSALKELDTTKKQIVLLDEQLHFLDTQQGEKADLTTFFCEKIGDDCPFLERIAHTLIRDGAGREERTQKQREKLLSQRHHLSEEVLLQHQNVCNQIAEEIRIFQSDPMSHMGLLIDQFAEQKKSLQDEFVSQDQEARLVDITTQISHTQERLNTLKTFLQDIERKSVQEHLQEIELLAQKKESLQRRSDELQQRIQHGAQQREKLVALQERMHMMRTQKDQLETHVRTLILQREELGMQLKQLPTQDFETSLEYLQQVRKANELVHHLMDSYKEQQHQVHILQEKEKKLSDLVKILGKDLIWEILRTSIPVLEDALNSALGQIVSYELKMDLIETKTGSLELVTRVVDELGEREVKSLSGGQKVMLKLAWILTIAAYLKVPCLLLDETINNLDQEAVSQISQLLESFVKKQRMKLYVVTHSSQIQDLSIWDETIALEREKAIP